MIDVTDVAKAGPSKKDVAIAKEKGVLGVCLLARDGTGSYRPLSSGSVVRGLIELQECQNKVFLITSDNIVSREELPELQSDRKAFHRLTGGYRLNFKQRSDKGTKCPKEYDLCKITSAKDKVSFVHGLAIIPIDSNAQVLSKRSGILDYRPFGINKEETKSSGGLICQIVDGTTDTFAVTPFYVHCVNEEYCLKLPEENQIFRTLKQLKEYSPSLRPHGAVILNKNSDAVDAIAIQAVGVLTFVEDRISPIWFSQLLLFGSPNISKRSLAKEPEESESDGSSKAPSEILLHSEEDNQNERTGSAGNSGGKVSLVTGRKSCTKKVAYNSAKNGVDLKVLIHGYGDNSVDREKQGKDKVNENTSLAKLSARLKQTAADEGFTTVDNDGVGNCMFYALADQLQHVKGLELSHLKVRQSIVQFLRNNPQWADLYEFVRHRYPSWDNYLTEMEQDGAWGDDLILKAAADLFETKIFVFSNESRKHDRTINPRKDSGSKQLVLGHICELHYVSLRHTHDSFKPPDDSKSSLADGGGTVKQGSISAERAAEGCISLHVVTESLEQVLRSTASSPDEDKILIKRSTQEKLAVSAVRSAPSSPDEKTCASKLKNLLKEGGTAALRGVFNKKHAPENLKEDLFANISCLGSLLHQQILSKRQWDMLFPPDGSEPDANTFDLILLFILLANISGEPPPPATWFNNPPKRHDALVADLARFRFLHDQLCATGVSIDKRRFSALWHEISTVLLNLGLEQSEIDRLKKPCREEHYSDVLIGWVYRKHQDEPDDFCREKERPPPTMEQLVQEMFQLMTNTQDMIRRSVIKRKQDASSNTGELILQRVSTSVQTEHVQARDNQTLTEAVATEMRELSDALSELSDDDENLEEIDEGDGGGSLHHLHMLIFSVALSSLLTYYSVCSLK